MRALIYHLAVYSKDLIIVTVYLSDWPHCGAKINILWISRTIIFCRKPITNMCSLRLSIAEVVNLHKISIVCSGEVIYHSYNWLLWRIFVTEVLYLIGYYNSYLNLEIWLCFYIWFKWVLMPSIVCLSKFFSMFRLSCYVFVPSLISVDFLM